MKVLLDRVGDRVVGMVVIIWLTFLSNTLTTKSFPCDEVA